MERKEAQKLPVAPLAELLVRLTMEDLGRLWLHEIWTAHRAGLPLGLFLKHFVDKQRPFKPKICISRRVAMPRKTLCVLLRAFSQPGKGGESI
jgi:hypothetical protein